MVQGTGSIHSRLPWHGSKISLAEPASKYLFHQRPLRLLLEYNDKSIPYGWRWIPGDSPELPTLTVADAMSLTLVEDLLRPLLPGAILQSLEPRFKHARNKLEAMADTNPNARWVDKVRQLPPSMPLMPPKISDEVLETVQQGLLSDRQSEVDYRRPEAETEKRLRLHPLGLVQRGPMTYLVATASEYKDVRIYAVSRMSEAALLKEAVRKPEGFSLDEYIGKGGMEFGDGKKMVLVAVVEAWLAAILAETPLSGDQQLSEVEEGVRLTVTVNDTPQLRWWILSFGYTITVMEPEELRKEISGTLKRAARGYK
jgi:predicted DNA-binding transcriptional regulator YafY